MKKRDAILAVLAVILVLSASIGAASAYFTSYAEARAGYVVHMGYETVIDEDVEGNVKTVRITNQAGQGTAAGTYPVFVRVKVYYGSDCAVSVPETAAGDRYLMVSSISLGTTFTHWFAEPMMS